MANLYDLKRFDLNLLVIFECIYQHLSISKAAETLFITPSAVSQSLQRLRVQLNDPLFVRSGKGISPTTVGANLHHHLAENLNQIEQTINITSQSELTRRFVIYGPQMFFSGSTMDLVTRLLEDPGVEIDHYDYMTSSNNIEELMSYRKADIAISLTPLINRSVICEPFKKLTLALICRTDHPRLHGKITMEQLAQERFAIYNTEDLGLKSVQSAIDEILPNRKIGFRSNSLIGMANIIQGTDLIGILPHSLLETLAAEGKVKEIISPIPLGSAMTYIIYNRSSLNTPSFTKLIEIILKNNVQVQG